MRRIILTILALAVLLPSAAFARSEYSSGKPVTLVFMFTRKTDKTCAKQVVLTMDDGKKIEKQLPLDTPVELATFPKAGKLGYACGWT